MFGWMGRADQAEAMVHDVVEIDGFVRFVAKRAVALGVCKIELFSGRALDLRVVSCAPATDAEGAALWRCTAVVDDRTTNFRRARGQRRPEAVGVDGEDA